MKVKGNAPLGESLREPRRTVSAGILRDIISLQQHKGRCELEGLPTLCQTLGQIFSALDILEVTMSKVHQQSKTDVHPTLNPGIHSMGVGPHLGTPGNNSHVRRGMPSV